MKINELTEQIYKLLNSVYLIVSILLIKPIANILTDRRNIRLRRRISTEPLYQKLSKKFIKGFVTENDEEIYFFFQTGVKANPKERKLLREFHQDLPGRFHDWNVIRKIMPRIDLKSDEVLIKINTFDRIVAKVMGDLLPFLLIISSFGIFIYLTKDITPNLPLEFVQSIILALTPLAMRACLMNLTKMDRLAISVEKRMKKEASQ